MKCFICTNILNSVDAAAYVAHCNFWYQLGKQYPKDSFYSMTPPRMAIDQARNWAARMALEQECDYLMFIDDDMLIHPNTLSSLIKADLDIVMAHTYIRGFPFNVMSFKSDGKGGLRYFNDFIEHIDENGIYLCDAVGFAVCLIKVKLLKEMEMPFFVTGTGHTEDIYFCCKARAEVSPDVNIENIEKLKEYYKPVSELNGEAKSGDRGTGYYRQIQQVLGEVS